MSKMAISFEADDYEKAAELFFEKGWTDGLPVTLPTRKLVEAMIDAGGLDRNLSLGQMPPNLGEITIEKLAVNAVMGGCLPAHFPIVIAAIKAMQQPQFNLQGVIQTTHMCNPLIIVNGPIARELGFNSRDGAFGNGNRSNAAVGRAVRLAIWNLGGARPGETDMCTLSNPCEYTYCVAEEEEDNPYQPISVERGCPEGGNAVTVFACEAPHSVTTHGTIGSMLHHLADSMIQLGNNNVAQGGQLLVVLNPRVAAEFDAAGWSKNDIRNYLWENARRKAEDYDAIDEFHQRMRSSLMERNLISPRNDPKIIRNGMIPITDAPGDIHIIVAGGRTYFSAVCPGWGAFGGYAATQVIEKPAQA